MSNTPYLDKFGEDEPKYVTDLLDKYWDSREKFLSTIEGDKSKEEAFVAEVEEEKTLFIALRRYGALKDLTDMPFEDVGALLHNKSIIDRIEGRATAGIEDLVKMLRGASSEINGVLKAYIDK
jgi:hypothetical protein